MTDDEDNVYLARPLSDDEITGYIADPATIQSHEVALHVIDCLNTEIANIQMQIDAAQIESNAKPLSAEREGWLRRASYAAAIRRNERHCVMQRDKELRGMKGPANTPPRHSREEKALKQQRLLEEAVARRLAKQVEREKVQLEFERLTQARRELKNAPLWLRIKELEAKLKAAGIE